MIKLQIRMINNPENIKICFFSIVCFFMSKSYCAQDGIIAQVWYYNPRYGEVQDSDLRFKNALHECQSKYYKIFIEREGLTELNVFELLDIRNKYYASKERQVKLDAGYVESLDFLHNSIVACIPLEKNFSMVRVDILDASSKEIISTLDMSGVKDTNW